MQHHTKQVNFCLEESQRSCFLTWDAEEGAPLAHRGPWWETRVEYQSDSEEQRERIVPFGDRRFAPCDKKRSLVVGCRARGHRSRASALLHTRSTRGAHRLHVSVQVSRSALPQQLRQRPSDRGGMSSLFAGKSVDNFLDGLFGARFRPVNLNLLPTFQAFGGNRGDPRSANPPSAEGRHQLALVAQSCFFSSFASRLSLRFVLFGDSRSVRGSKARNLVLRVHFTVRANAGRTSCWTRLRGGCRPVDGSGHDESAAGFLLDSVQAFFFRSPMRPPLFNRNSGKYTSGPCMIYFSTSHGEQQVDGA